VLSEHLTVKLHAVVVKMVLYLSASLLFKLQSIVSCFS